MFKCESKTHCRDSHALYISFLISGRQSVALQQPDSCLLLSDDFHSGHHHAVFSDERVLQQGQPGSSLQWHHLFHPLPTSHPVLCLARPHHQEHETGCSMFIFCLKYKIRPEVMLFKHSKYDLQCLTHSLNY